LVGWMIGDSLNLGVHPWVVMAGGAGVLAAITMLTYRFALIATLATVCGVLAPLAVLTLAQGSAADAEPQSSLIHSSGLMSGFREILAQQNSKQSQIEDSLSFWRSTLKDSGKLNEENANRHIEQVRSFGSQALDMAKSAWLSTPSGIRPTLAASAIIGTIAGL